MAAKDLAQQMERAANEGWAALQDRQWLKAEAAYDRAMKLSRQSGDTLAEALFRSYRGQARRADGRALEARQDVEHALAVGNSRNCAQLLAHTQFLLAQFDWQEGDESKAVDRLLAALDAALACQDLRTAELAFGELGQIYAQQGFLEAACDCFAQALCQNPEGDNQVAWLGNLGQTLCEMGQLEESIDYYRRALQAARLEGDVRAQARCLASEGLSHFHKQRYAEAIDCYKQALKLSEQESDLDGNSTWLGNLGNVYLRLGEAQTAVKLAEDALRIARQINDRWSQAAHLDTLGDCFLEQGDYEAALRHYKNALDIGQDIKDKLGQRIYLSNVARACKRMGQTQRALSYFKQAIALFEEQRSRIKADALKTSFAATGQNLYRDAIEACLESGNRVEALEYVGRAKSRAILDLLRNSPIDVGELEASNDKAVLDLVARERDLSRQIARLESIFWQGPQDGDQGHRGVQLAPEDAPRLYRQWRQVLDQLRRRHRNYANMVAVDSLRFPELQALWGPGQQQLGADTAIVEFFLSDKFLFAAAIWEGCLQPAVQITLDSKDLAGLLDDVADFLEMSSTEGWEVPAGICKRLYERLLAPLVVSLPAEVNRLIIVPHGVLHRLPFAALHDGERYLIERYCLSYLPSASLIPVLSRQPEAAADSALPYLVSAISDYSATRSEGIVFSSRLRSSAGLDDLTYTLEEGNTVFALAAQHAPEAKLLTNAEVKEGLLNLFGDYPVVHFAGHAVFNPDEPLASGLVLADGSILTAARILQDNALRTRCGKLLVLSACQTGVNVVTNGGEILGLARALMYAGMPNLILSLWEVADRSTSELMREFHHAWQGGKCSVAQALATAQRKAASEQQPVHAWAPFVHLGAD